MAVALEYQTWASADYNWADGTTASKPPQQIQQKLAAWVAAVNANAVNASKQITILKTPSDSTLANYIGWNLSLASGASGSTFYASLYSSSTTNLNCRFSAGWTNDGTNGGYGTVTGGTSVDTSIAWYTSAQTAEFAIATETAAGEEFFLLGWRLATNTSYSDQLVIFKDINGEWAAAFSDGGVVVGTFYMPVHTTPQRQYGCQIDTAWGSQTGYVDTLTLTSNGSFGYVPATGNSFTGSVSAASPNLFMTGSTGNYGFGKWGAMANGKALVCMGYGPFCVLY